MLVTYPYQSVLTFAYVRILHKLIGEVLPVRSAIPVPLCFVLTGSFDNGFSTAAICLSNGYYFSSLTSTNYWHGLHPLLFAYSLAHPHRKFPLFDVCRLTLLEAVLLKDFCHTLGESPSVSSAA